MAKLKSAPLVANLKSPFLAVPLRQHLCVWVGHLPRMGVRSGDGAKGAPADDARQYAHVYSAGCDLLSGAD